MGTHTTLLWIYGVACSGHKECHGTNYWVYSSQYYTDSTDFTAGHLNQL